MAISRNEDDASPAIDVVDFIDRRPVGGFQIRLLLTCAAVLFLDGFDTQAMGYVAPALAKEWGLSKAALGPVFATSSKRQPDPVVGLAELRRCRGLVEKPLVAIGGITLENASQVWKAGADSVAVIGGLLPEPATAQSLRERMEEWQGLQTATCLRSVG